MKVQVLYVDVGMGVEEIRKLTGVIEREADVEVNQEFDKELAKVVEEVNKEVVLDKEADMEANQEVDKEVANVVRRV